MTYIAKVWHKTEQRYTGLCMRAKGKQQHYPNLEALAKNLKLNTEYYGDTSDLEVHVFKLETPAFKFEADKFYVRDITDGNN